MRRAWSRTARRLPASGAAAASGPIAAFGPDGALIALLTEDQGEARPLAVVS